MVSSSRRVWLPWLLLVVPTVLIGATALGLLRAEQRRLDAARGNAQARAAAALQARAQVTADNIELFVSEIRDGLIRELAETPEADLAPLLANWPRTNPLVTETFLWRPDRRALAWPPADTPAHAAFRTRYAELFRGSTADLAAASRQQEGEFSQPTSLPPGSQGVNAEVAQSQALRRDVQQAAKISAYAAKNYVSPEPAVRAEKTARKQSNAADSRIDIAGRAEAGLPADAAEGASAKKAEQRQKEAEVAQVAAPAARGNATTGEATRSRLAKVQESPPPSRNDRAITAALSEELRRAGAPGAVAKPGMDGTAASDESLDREESSFLKDAGDVAAPPARTSPGFIAPPKMDTRSAPWGEPASGWLGRTIGGTVYFLGWWQPPGGGPVRGVELNLPAVLERVQAFIPPNALGGERYGLWGPGEGDGSAHVSIPLSTTLPGWRLVAWMAPAARGELLSLGSAFFVVAVLLVLAFAAAIVGGGTIFFRQAAAAEREAALKTNFVSNVSHEMKTPLTTIRMYAEMLADDRVADPEKRRRYFATIGRETARLGRLVNNALDFGRLEAGRKEYRAETIVLEDWMQRLAELQAPRFAETGLRLAITPAPAGATVRCDPDSLEQMALNLIDNAVKYAAVGGEVSLCAEPAGASWSFVVADRGPGVPAAHREKIFERFHRVDETLTAKTAGAGLGLTIARRLARDQGGDLVYRDRPGGGAEFVLTLPAKADE